MGRTIKDQGQRTNNTSDSGKKARSETRRPHKGSRLEPEHVTEQRRAALDKNDRKNAPETKPGASREMRL